MPFDKPDSYRHCGAKTRQGTACKAPAMRNGRCRMHGGKSPHDINSPHFRHGYYVQDGLSLWLWAAIQDNYRQRLRDERIARYFDTCPAPMRQEYKSDRAYARALNKWRAGGLAGGIRRSTDVIPAEAAATVYAAYQEHTATGEFTEVLLLAVSGEIG